MDNMDPQTRALLEEVVSVMEDPRESEVIKNSHKRVAVAALLEDLESLQGGDESELAGMYREILRA